MRITGAGGALSFGLIKTVGEAIDYVDRLLGTVLVHTDLLQVAKQDLHAANDSGKPADIATARASLVKSLGEFKILVKNSVTGLG